MLRTSLFCLALVLSCAALAPSPAKAAPAPDFDWEQVNVGYLPAYGEWWSGLAITNISSSTITPEIKIYNSDGTQVDTHVLEPLAPQEMFVTVTSDLHVGLQMWTTVVSAIVTSMTDDAKFVVTSFVGNSQMGFGMQQQTSVETTWTMIPL